MKKVLMINFLIFIILINSLTINYASGIVLPDDEWNDANTDDTNTNSNITNSNTITNNTNTNSNTTNTNTNSTPLLITEENLQNSLNELVKELAKNTSEHNSTLSIVNDMKIDSANKRILVTTQDGNNYNLYYDLTDKPTFYREVLIEEGMSYDEYDKAINNIGIFQLYAYMASIMTTGISSNDVSAYLGKIILTTLFSSIPNINNNSLTAAPNFEDGVITYFDAQFPKNIQIITDKEFLDTLTITYKKENLTETSRKLKYTITINPEADFSKIDGYAKELENKTVGDITKDNADYSIELAVGETYTFTHEKNAGYTISGNNYIEIDVIDNKYTITGLKPGIVRGYLYEVKNINGVIDHANRIEKTLYITEKEKKSNQNTNNNNNTSTSKPTVNNNTIKPQVNNIKNTIPKSPQTGNFFEITHLLFLLCICSTATLIYIILKSIKYKK